ncbi:hypothetical protein PDESU_01113 [Pontiella desulfatans]|uniref:Integrase SAM-like N-terminal domain-containing protein n=1 Tax=Pontiella desulfatans TaxID=2750659 RepID=A0A6C2TY13_PONDE|nr:phage integrase N-terminal SAM-like domain-containing protein [Pontiella desulfatans]VGO12560.1 hypothetical protein PDESU_01113 [Pontiella desulfatans]
MEDKKKFKPDKNHKLMDQVRETMRYYHYAYRTEQTYCDWIKRFLAFYGMSRHPSAMGAPEVERYLSHLAEKQGVAASTQRQALNAISFSTAMCSTLISGRWPRCAASGIASRRRS